MACLFSMTFGMTWTSSAMTTSAILDRIHALLANTPPFDQLSGETRQELVGSISVEYFEPDTVIIEQGSSVHKGLYLVESGLVRLMDIEQQQLIDKCGDGDVFGSFGLLKGGASIYEAKAVEPTVCALLDKARFQDLYDGNKDFAAYFENDIRWYLRRQGMAMDISGSYLLFSRRLEQLAHRQPVVVTPDLTAQEAAQRMSKGGVHTLLVMRGKKIAGILTDGDLRARLIARGRPLDTPVRSLMSSSVVTVSQGVSLFEAMMKMLESGVRNLVIVDNATGREVPVGILMQQDLMHFRGLDPVATVTRMEHVTSVAELANVRAEMSEHLLRLYQQGVPAERLGRLAAVIYDRIAVRVLELVEQELRAAAGKQRVTLPWVWLRLGSSGRQEMALNSAQHNAVLYATPATDAERAKADAWFNALAEQANKALEVCGFTMSNIVARDPRRRMSLRQWKQTYRTWIFETDEEGLAVAPIFFDVRGIYGEMALADELKEDVEDALNVQMLDRERKFLPLLAGQALSRRPPLSFFNRFVVERSGEHRFRFDIREHGILPVVDAARVLALETRFFGSMNTYDRLRHVAEALPELAETLEATLDAYQYLVDFRMEHQLNRVDSGEPPDNHIDPASLTKIQRSLLRSAFASAAALQKELAKRFDVARGLRPLRPRSSG